MRLRKSISLVVFAFASLTVFGVAPEKSSDSSKKLDRPSLAAGCTAANEIAYLEFNNVRTRIETGGLWWQDRPNRRADYEVPKGSNSYALYAGGLWLGGTDVNGQLKAAVSKFGSGVDYYTGPLDTTGTAEINAETCDEWDRFFEISKQEVLEFVLYRQSVDAGTVGEDYPDGYEVPKSIKEWPGNGNVAKGQASRIAPYVDVNGDGFYDYRDGDYPYYDLGSGFNNFIPDSLLNENGSVDCRAPRVNRGESATRPLFGDKTFWWIFNDKGNLHSESKAPPIGMEIHAQAFAFATNDEINDMTFYNFELINRSTFTLTDTYFASYVDPDLGYPFDDYVGCDVQRGFGYCYNGDDFDPDYSGEKGYGSTPAVIGIDFFEGPYQDADGIDNEVGIGPGEALNGLGYGDGIIDNERFGMRRFVYYNNSTSQNGDPELAIHYYNYMRGIWKNGQRMRHGGNGYNGDGVENIETYFMFPGKSDPLHWGTTDKNGITTVPANTNWTEINTGGAKRNDPGDRRFLQSAGPFTLEPGNVNDITVGVVFGQAESGGVQASIEKAFNADDKAQALFDNCFQVLNGPDAPVLEIQELNQELILYLTNPPSSNNANEDYEEVDPNIITPDTLLNMNPPIEYDNTYKFQGYQVFQLRRADVSVSQIYDPSLARLVFQCDIQDGVTKLTNFTFDEGLNASIPQKMVDGSNEGIIHSYRVTEDLFAQSQTDLVNYKTYYYIAIAYAYNEFKPYVQDQAPDLDNPLAGAYDGQKRPYLASRKSADGGSIQAVSAIPHDVRPEGRGTKQNSNYGDLVEITRLQGQGNGNHAVELSNQTLERLLNDKDWETGKNPVELTYKKGRGPITVKVADPLNLVDGKFYFKMLDDNLSTGEAVVTDNAKWMIWKEGGDTVYSTNTIKTRTEQLLFEPNWGLSILIEQTKKPGKDLNNKNGYITSRMIFEDSTKAWLTGIPDGDGEDEYNWILSGTVDSDAGSQSEYNDRKTSSGDYIDPNEDFENILGGRWSPYALVGYGLGTNDRLLKNKPGYNQSSVQNSKLEYLNSTVIVYTKDKSKWTRCPVIELQETSTNAINGDAKYNKRTIGSVDKDGNQWRPGDPVDLNNPNSPSYIDSVGMGWFPGYAINMETGERLNMAYGEDSYYGVSNGADMIWNPTSTIRTGTLPGNLVWGGKHVTYVFRKTLKEENLPEQLSMPNYDNGKRLKELLSTTNTMPFAYRACNWVNIPILVEGKELLETDAYVYLNVTRPYDTLITNIGNPKLENEGRPVYAFETKGIAVKKSQLSTLKEAIEDINIVPNPYYAISEYEGTSLDNVAKIINLPERCNIRIYNVSGTLIREYKKSDPTNYLDWDLKNHFGIPIASGVYIIHIDVPGAGEKILKWFGIMRPVDLNNF